MLLKFAPIVLVLGLAGTACTKTDSSSATTPVKPATEEKAGTDGKDAERKEGAAPVLKSDGTCPSGECPDTAGNETCPNGDCSDGTCPSGGGNCPTPNDGNGRMPFPMPFPLPNGGGNGGTCPSGGCPTK